MVMGEIILSYFSFLFGDVNMIFVKKFDYSLGAGCFFYLYMVNIFYLCNTNGL